MAWTDTRARGSKEQIRGADGRHLTSPSQFSLQPTLSPQPTLQSTYNPVLSLTASIVQNNSNRTLSLPITSICLIHTTSILQTILRLLQPGLDTPLQVITTSLRDMVSQLTANTAIHRLHLRHNTTMRHRATMLLSGRTPMALHSTAASNMVSKVANMAPMMRATLKAIPITSKTLSLLECLRIRRSQG